MNVMHSDCSVIYIQTKDGISINMFVETASILYKELGFVLNAIGHLERSQNTKELAATDSQQAKGKIIAFDASVSPTQITIEINNTEGLVLGQEVAITSPVC